MGRSTVRWIAIAVIGGMVAVLAVGLVGSGGDPAADESARTGTGSAVGASAADALDGPHLILELCTGVACPEVDEDAQLALQAEVEGDPRVASSVLVTSEEAYQQFLDEFGDQQEMVEALPPEDVPARLELDLHDPAAVPDLAAALEPLEGVASVVDVRTAAP